jgi:3',5'-cyclic AMP phosphodiesterase CpdA
MRLVAHISDLHFGRHDTVVAEALVADITAMAPALVAVSGDLTQRARSVEFAAARAFLDRLPMPTIVVPGNHDVPLYNLTKRLFTPLHRFRRFITSERYPFYMDDELAVLGIDTARSATISNGRISDRQMHEIRAVFDRVPPGRFRLLVTHHPLMPPPESPGREIVGRAVAALAAVEAAGVDLLLAGHYHHSYMADISSFHATVGRSILVAQAGTAISTRTRTEENAYNLIRIEPLTLDCQVRVFCAGRFVDAATHRFRCHGGRWLPAP